MIKFGIITEESQSDFDLTKKAAYYDDADDSQLVADEANKNKLKNPKKLEFVKLEKE